MRGTRRIDKQTPFMITDEIDGSAAQLLLEGKMAEYHVGCGAFGIYAGTLNSHNKNLWQNKTECTDEAICAVRDYIVQDCLGGPNCEKATSGGYEWTLKDGRVVELRVTIKSDSKD